MVGNEELNEINEEIRNENGLKKRLIVKNIVTNKIEYMTNITDLDLSDRKISKIDENLEIPPNLVHLKLSNNELTEVPLRVLELHNLKTLDLSYNSIVFFNDTPSFCHTVEWLNLSNNCLEGPPDWVWTEKPNKLSYLNLSNNKKLFLSFTYFDKLLQYNTLVNEIDVHNCNISKYIKLMATFCHAKIITLGSQDYNHHRLNYLDQFPCAGLEDCREVEIMNVSNTRLYHINSNIDIYQNIIELNLAKNNLNSLPNEFCNLKNLQTCIISSNELLYLPDSICKLTKLVRLYLDENKLCMLPDTLHKITSLRTLDLYSNNLHEGLENIDYLEELDFAQNYFDEPGDEEYLLKKKKLRVNTLDREDGRKIEMTGEDSDSNTHHSDEELYALNAVGSEDDAVQDVAVTRSSSPEDWDSDDWWIPQYYKPVTPPSSPWLFFVKRKMEEGNFCPIDAHPVSIGDQVKYEKYCNPPVEHESDGQFDDYSDDDS